MYKVFVNEKKLTLGKYPTDIEKKLPYEGFATLDIAIDLLENTSCKEINIYSEKLDEMWQDFSKVLKVVEAAGGIIFNKNKEILFIYRLGKWDLPKGKIEKGESLESAALREVEEETALGEMILEKFVNSTYHIYTEKRNKTRQKILKTTHWFLMTYNGNSVPKPQIEEGITKVEWKNKNQILKEVLPNTFQNIKLILNEIWDEKLAK